MALLVLFAFVAGAGTALSPCVLPVLPALLSAGATGGRRRPLGIVLGLTITFTITIVGLAKLVDGVGLGVTATRDLAIAALLLFGLAVAVPSVGDRIEAPLSRLARFGPKGYGSGFWSGMLVGAALGFLYAPCAGPVLAAVVSVSAASGRVVLVGLAYAAGSAVVLLALALLGRRLADLVRGPALTRALGFVMVITAVAMAFQVDVRFQTAIANHLPSALVNPTKSIETSAAATKQLDKLRPPSRFAQAAHAATPQTASPDLRDYGPRARLHRQRRLVQLQAADARRAARARRARRLLDLHLHQLHPHAAAPDGVGQDLSRRRPDHRRRPLARVLLRAQGVQRERGDQAERHQVPGRAGQRARHLERLGNQYWPAEYLIDANGHVRHVNFGEGDYDGTEAAIRALLKQAGAKSLPGDAKPAKSYDVAQDTTPETYLGLERTERIVPETPKAGPGSYTAVTDVPVSHFTYGGDWTFAQESATAGVGATLTGHVAGKDVYLVLAPVKHGSNKVGVTVDGKPEQTIQSPRRSSTT